MGAKKPGGGPDRDAMIASLAGAIRELFVANYRAAKLATTGVATDWGSRHMARWDGGEGDTGTFESTWARAAALCLDREMEIGAFVKAQFVNLGADVPFPNRLLGEAAVDRYRLLEQKAPEDLRAARRVQQNVFTYQIHWRRKQRQLDEVDSIRSVLVDGSVGLSNLFRHCSAAHHLHADIADMFRDAAFRQYLFQRRAYDLSWGDFIPAALREDAASFLAALTQK
jgi:hypothetical protein